MKADLLGINITFISYEELLNSIFKSDIKTVTYANQYVLNESFKNEKLRKSIQSFDLVHADGIGVQKALKRLYNRSAPRVNGSDLYYRFFEKLNEKLSSIFIYGSEKDVIDKAVKFIKNKYPKIIISGFIDGYEDVSDEKIIEEINRKSPEILFVATGTPNQEEWISKYKQIIKASKIIAIGGGLRVISGDRHRGPVFIRKAGLEWLVRLFEEPVRYFKRYVIGIPLFITRINKQKNIQRKILNEK